MRFERHLRFFLQNLLSPAPRQGEQTGKIDRYNQQFVAEKGIILGKPRQDGFYNWWGFKSSSNMFFRLSGDLLEHHILTIAPTGSGKGVGLVIPNLLEYEHSVMVIDPKGENYLMTAQVRGRNGRKVILLDPFGECEKRKNDDVPLTPYRSFNPLDFLSVEDENVGDDCAVLADMLVLQTGQEKDPHWNDKARAILKGLILYVVRAGKPKTLAELRRVVVEELCNNTVVGRHGETRSYQFVQVLKNYPDDKIINRTGFEIESMPNEERGSVLSTVLRHTEFLDSQSVAHCLDQSDMSSDELLALLRTGQLSLYFVLPADKFSAYARVMRLWIGTAIQLIAKHPLTRAEQDQGNRILFMLDEVAQLGTMEPLLKGIGLMRGYGMILWMVFQDIGQLKSLYPDHRWISFMSNCKIKLFFGISDYDTAKYISDMIGKETKYVTATTIGQHGGQAKSLLPGSNQSATVSQKDMEVMTPDRIMDLPNDRIFIFAQGHSPIEANRVDYRKDPYFQS
jgi:type IV secretion system protein VirD4